MGGTKKKRYNPKIVIENPQLVMTFVTGSLVKLYHDLRENGIVREAHTVKENGEPLGRLDTKKFYELCDVAAVFVDERVGEADEKSFTGKLYAKWGMKQPGADPLQSKYRYFCANCHHFAHANECPHAYAVYMLRNGEIMLRDKRGRGRPKMATTQKKTRENCQRAAKRRRLYQAAASSPEPRHPHDSPEPAEPPAPTNIGTLNRDLMEPPTTARSLKYHETQFSDHCLLHATNNVLGCRAFTPADFRNAAEKLTAEAPTDLAERYAYQKDGNWEIEVAQMCLQNRGYEVDYGYQGKVGTDLAADTKARPWTDGTREYIGSIMGQHADAQHFTAYRYEKQGDRLFIHDSLLSPPVEDMEKSHFTASINEAKTGGAKVSLHHVYKKHKE